MARERLRRDRALRPGFDGASNGNPIRLEPRLLMASAARTAFVAGLPLPAVRLNRAISPHDRIPQSPRNYVQTFVANGGKAAVMIDTDGEIFVAHVKGRGTVRAKAAPQGKVDLFIYGSNANTSVTIDPAYPTPGTQTAHQFPTGTTIQDSLIHLRNVTVTNGKIGQILGYKTADVSGAVAVVGQNQPDPTVDRIAFSALLPGASLSVPGTLFTLDIHGSISLDGGIGIVTGQDLDAMNVGGTLSLVNGASVRVGRDLGAVPQQAKGTGPAGVGMDVNGDLVIANGGTISVGRYFGSPFTLVPIIIRGSSEGITELPSNTQAMTQVYGVRG